MWICFLQMVWMFVSVKHCGGEVMIAGFDFLSLTNFWGGFLKESFTPAFCWSGVFCCRERERGFDPWRWFLITEESWCWFSADLWGTNSCKEVITANGKASDYSRSLRLQSNSSQTSLICLVLLDVKRDESDRSHSAGFTAMVDGVNVGLPWRREDHLTHIHITSVMLGSVSRVMFCRRHVSALSSPPRSPLLKEVIKDA